MTVFSSCYAKHKKKPLKVFHIVMGTLFSVLIYYMNYFSSLLGQNERLPETFRFGYLY